MALGFDVRLASLLPSKSQGVPGPVTLSSVILILGSVTEGALALPQQTLRSYLNLKRRRSSFIDLT
jgi:hypothetical protein